MENKQPDFIQEKEANKLSKNKKTIIALIAAGIFLVAFFLGFFANFLTQSKYTKLINELYQIIEDKSATDGENLTEEELAEKFVLAALANDSYAKYYSKAEYEKLLKEEKGEYQGIGVTLLKNRVISVVWNSPAEKSGLTAGDEIIEGKMGDKNSAEQYRSFTEDGSLNEFLSNLEKDATVTLKVQRGTDQIVEIEVVKTVYKVRYVLYRDNSCAYKPDLLHTDAENTDLNGGDATLANDTAYIKLTQFEGEAGVQFRAAMQIMKNRGKTKLILDLSDNGGGSMEVLISVASLLINNGGKDITQIAYVKYNSYDGDFCTSENLYNEDIEEIAIIANKNTASASEVLIGAMDYYGGGTGGDKFSVEDNLITTFNEDRQDFSTFGKGIMQTIYPLKNGGAIKLTTAKLYLPGYSLGEEVCIHDVGFASLQTANNVYSHEEAMQRAINMFANS